MCSRGAGIKCRNQDENRGACLYHLPNQRTGPPAGITMIRCSIRADGDIGTKAIN